MELKVRVGCADAAAWHWCMPVSQQHLAIVMVEVEVNQVKQ